MYVNKLILDCLTVWVLNKHTRGAI